MEGIKMLAGALLAASLALTAAQSQKIDAAVEQVMTADHISGLSLGVARKGRVLLLRGYGARADGDTVYRIGSLTKQFTAALALQQIERGNLSLTTATHGVTVQQLLAQTSGLPTYTSDEKTEETALQSQPVFEPGTQFEYSNTNYYVLGQALEAVTHSTYPALLAEGIASPLGLRATVSGDDGATGISSSARDVLAWLEALRSGRVVSSANFNAMTSSQELPSGEHTHYGYGFYIRDWYGWKTAEHPGYVDGFSADDALVVDNGLEIAVLASATNAYLVPITKTVVQLLEPPRDTTLVADFSHPAQNENPSVTRDVTELVHELQRGTLDRARLTASLNKTMTAQQVLEGKQLFAPLGDLTLVEFIDRTSVTGSTFEKYRLSFGYKQFWMTLSYAADGKIDTLAIQQDDD